MTDMIEHTLQALADAHDGRLSPEIVVQSARDPASPLHSRFEWDDTKAAEEHRRSQARTLIRSVRVEFRTETFSFTAPAYIREPGLARVAGYISTGRLASDEDKAREAVVAEFSRASSALKRAQEVATALGLSEDIAKIQGQIVHLIGRATSVEASVASN